MHISFEEFEKTMALAHNVFQTWDDEYEKVGSMSKYGHSQIWTYTQIWAYPWPYWSLTKYNIENSLRLMYPNMDYSDITTHYPGKPAAEGGEQEDKKRGEYEDDV
eukprot:sb/3477987/